jgi:hypothetical protein
MAVNGTLNIRLMTAEWTPAEEPDADIVVSRTVNTELASFRGLAFPPPQELDYSTAAGSDQVFASVSCSRFRTQMIGFFFADSPPPDCVLTVLREPDAWAPTFTHLNDLVSSDFLRLKAVLSVSDQVDMLDETPIDLMGNYDAFTDDSDAAILAKMCLLNLYSVLTEEIDPKATRPWFDAVQKIVRIDRERTVFEVEPWLYDSDPRASSANWIRAPTRRTFRAATTSKANSSASRSSTSRATSN